jgi:hypothetical protein
MNHDFFRRIQFVVEAYEPYILCPKIDYTRRLGLPSLQKIIVTLI